MYTGIKSSDKWKIVEYTLLLELGTPHSDPCAECGSVLVLRWNKKYGPYYGCINYPACRGSAGAHNDGFPNSNPGKLRLKQARVTAHQIIEAWREHQMLSKNEVKTWLIKKFGKEIHVGYMNMDEVMSFIKKMQELYSLTSNE